MVEPAEQASDPLSRSPCVCRALKGRLQMLISSARLLWKAQVCLAGALLCLPLAFAGGPSLQVSISIQSPRKRRCFAIASTVLARRHVLRCDRRRHLAIASSMALCFGFTERFQACVGRELLASYAHAKGVSRSQLCTAPSMALFDQKQSVVKRRNRSPF